MSVGRNFIFNFSANIYTAVLAMILAPIYFKHLGPSQYGLIAFYATVQAWFNLLDFGITFAISREATRYKANETSPELFWNALRGFEYLFWAVGLVSCAVLVLFSKKERACFLNTPPPDPPRL